MSGGNMLFYCQYVIRGCLRGCRLNGGALAAADIMAMTVRKAGKLGRHQSPPLDDLAVRYLAARLGHRDLDDDSAPLLAEMA
jgi:hypothetical protein